MDRKSLGTWGETQAARYLRLHGYSILERNFSCRSGEIDIIAKKGKFIVFAEVKLRKDSSFAEAREFVTYVKQRRILITAQLYLACHACDLQPRFDVLEVYAPDGEHSRGVRINHIKDAFQ